MERATCLRFSRSRQSNSLPSGERTSAGSQDTSPRFAASYYLYGSSWAIPIPDIDRTDYFLCLGANPLVSQGSFVSAPNMRARLRALRGRGGKLVVVDPRRSETAEIADIHLHGDGAALGLANLSGYLLGPVLGIIRYHDV